jgi:2-methylcitrate dehydratase PrpD
MPKFVAEGQEDPMRTLCRMVINTKYEDLPDNVITYAKHSILDTIGVTIGGSAMEAIPTMFNFVIDRGGKPESLIPFYGGRVPASEAGMVIGPMMRAMDLGDVHTEAVHTSEYTLSTLLAATGLKDKVSGKDLITAFVVGQEVLIRIGIAFRLISRGAAASAGGGHWIFGAVASAGKLLSLSQEELENAEGIARCQTQPHDLSLYSEGTLMVRIHHGFVCRDAINACLLAQRGITGPRREVLAGAKGYLGLAKWETDPEALTRDLGEKWEMLNTEMKPYPSCKCTHSATSGLLEQMKEHKFEAGDIASIDVDESTVNWTVACTPWEAKLNPQTFSECQFSLPYVMATAAFDGDFFLNSCTTEARARRDVRELMTRISAREDASLPQYAARVHTVLKDGRKFSTDCFYVKGHPNNPFTETELAEKLRKCVPFSAYKLSSKVVDSLIKTLLNLDKVVDVVNDVILPLTPK